MERSNLVLGLLVLILSSCSFRLIEVNYITPPKQMNPPQNSNTNPGISPIEALTKLSKQEGLNGTKSFVTHAAMTEPLVQELGLDPDNCAQAVELSTGEIVVDFANVACPPNRGLIPVDHLVFTLSYEQSSQTVWELAIDERRLGSADIDLLNKTATITSLCTKDYADDCKLTVTNGEFAGIE